VEDEIASWTRTCAWQLIEGGTDRGDVTLCRFHASDEAILASNRCGQRLLKAFSSLLVNQNRLYGTERSSCAVILRSAPIASNVTTAQHQVSGGN